jgi:hypothetical protein
VKLYHDINIITISLRDTGVFHAGQTGISIIIPPQKDADISNYFHATTGISSAARQLYSARERHIAPWELIYFFLFYYYFFSTKISKADSKYRGI